MRCLHVLAAAALLGIAACGGNAGSTASSASPAATDSGTTSGSASGSSPTSPASAAGRQLSADAHGWHEVVTVDPAATTVRVEVTVSGPLTLLGGCIPELSAWIVDSAGNRLPDPADTRARCEAIAVEEVPAGQVRALTATVPMPAGPGSYTVHGRVSTQAGGTGAENLPPIEFSL